MVSSPCPCCAAVLARLEAIEAGQAVLLEALRRETPRGKRTKERYRLIYDCGEHLGRDVHAARNLRKLLLGSGVTHDARVARIVAALRRDPECPTSERHLWSLLRHLGGIPPDEK
ncbi:hypothetical protein [Accumulibacter sp.]|jgi:hypothetical protein|uniref:hypothetical protein n=1 Tax=Accumulibacter sp. TaxID=2053492 RepID=UPI001AC4D513|nr:hypothetical protein [Accumulibacter sp.]MBN8452208.1 hypothetical protein [Accumulibacter sp.]MBO3708263.1 hypothetical protein [Candidatus Accumulibacter conexus]